MSFGVVDPKVAQKLRIEESNNSEERESEGSISNFSVFYKVPSKPAGPEQNYDEVFSIDFDSVKEEVIPGLNKISYEEKLNAHSSESTQVQMEVIQDLIKRYHMNEINEDEVTEAIENLVVCLKCPAVEFNDYDCLGSYDLALARYQSPYSSLIVAEERFSKTKSRNYPKVLLNGVTDLVVVSIAESSQDISSIYQCKGGNCLGFISRGSDNFEGTVLLSGSLENSVIFFNPEEEKLMFKVNLKEVAGVISETKCATTLDDRLIVVKDNWKLEVYDIPSSQFIEEIALSGEVEEWDQPLKTVKYSETEVLVFSICKVFRVNLSSKLVEDINLPIRDVCAFKHHLVEKKLASAELDGSRIFSLNLETLETEVLYSIDSQFSIKDFEINKFREEVLLLVQREEEKSVIILKHVEGRFIEVEKFSVSQEAQSIFSLDQNSFLVEGNKLFSVYNIEETKITQQVKENLMTKLSSPSE